MQAANSTEPIRDFEEHKHTYELFLRVVVMGTLHVAGILLALVITTIEGAPVLGVAGMVLISAAVIYGLLSPGIGNIWPGLAVIVVLGFLLAVLA